MKEDFASQRATLEYRRAAGELVDGGAAPLPPEIVPTISHSDPDPGRPSGAGQAIRWGQYFRDGSPIGDDRMLREDMKFLANHRT